MSVLPGSILQIDYCTHNVPDELVILNDPNSLDFISGNNVDTVSEYPYFHGYSYLTFLQDQLEVIVTNAHYFPIDIGCTATFNNPGGVMRLMYEIPWYQCKFYWTVNGNKEKDTVYSICIKVIKYGNPITSDTIVQHYCQPSEILHHTLDCDQIVIIPIDSEIKTEVNIEQSKCFGDYSGKIEFSEYPEYNLYNLDQGQYTVDIHNEFCHKEFKFLMKPDSLCDQYIPNIFSPNGDGINDKFIFFTAGQEVKYHLWIYDRWGELLFNESNLSSNIDGWDGTYKGQYCLDGVYVYRIVSENRTFQGDITLIH